MSLPTPPPEAKRTFEGFLAHLVQLGKADRNLKVDPDPVPIYFLTPDAVRRKAAEEARLIGWRFFAGAKDEKSVCGDISAASLKCVLGMTYGEAAKDAISLRNRLLSERRVAPASLAMLRIPSGLVNAFWSDPLTGAKNGRLFLIGRNLLDLQNQRLKEYDLEDVLKHLSDSSKKRKQDDTGASPVRPPRAAPVTGVPIHRR